MFCLKDRSIRHALRANAGRRVQRGSSYMAQRFQSLSFKVIATFILLTVLSIAVIDVLAYFASSRISDEQALKAKESVLIFRGDMRVAA